MKKPMIYLDTNIISAYWYEGKDLLCMARRTKTREWWQQERDQFRIFVSAATEDELSSGTFPRQRECLRFIRRFPYLFINNKVKRFAVHFVDHGVVPAEKPGDALQLAVCATHEIDYLLSWNYAHLVNPVAQEHLAGACRKLRLRAPLLVSPESIPKVSLGQTVRRLKS